MKTVATTTKKKLANNGANTDAEAVQNMYSTIPNNSKEQYDQLVKNNATSQTALNQANQQALKYAETTAQAQGYASQGAMGQNVSELGAQYMNAISQQNNTFNQNVANLIANGNSEAYDNGTSALESLIQGGNTTKDDIDKIKELYYNDMSNQQQKEFDYMLDKIGYVDTNKGNYDSSLNLDTDDSYTSFKDFAKNYKNIWGYDENKEYNGLQDVNKQSYETKKEIENFMNSSHKNGDSINFSHTDKNGNIDKYVITYVNGKYYVTFKNKVAGK